MFEYDDMGNRTFYSKSRNGKVQESMECTYNPNVDVRYLRARYYCPTRADFLTEDSYLGNIIDPLTLNRYNYVKSSPLNYTDPSGMYSWLEGKLAHAPLQLIFLASYGLGSDRISFSGRMNIQGSLVTDGFYGKTEVAIPKAGRFKFTTGYADMVLYNHNLIETYEIKPDTYRGSTAGKKQLDRYIECMKKRLEMEGWLDMGKNPIF